MSLYEAKVSSSEEFGFGGKRGQHPLWLLFFGAYLIFMSAWGHLSALYWWNDVGGLAEPIPSMVMLAKHIVGLMSICAIVVYLITKNSISLYYIATTSLISIVWAVLGLTLFDVPEIAGRFIYIFSNSIQSLPWFTLTQFHHFYDDITWTTHAIVVGDIVVCALFSVALIYFHKRIVKKSVVEEKGL